MPIDSSYFHLLETTVFFVIIKEWQHSLYYVDITVLEMRSHCNHQKTTM